MTRRHARVQSLLLGTIGVALSLALGPLPAVFAIVVLAAGLWYDIAAKGTVVSWVPFAIFIPSLPLWGFAAAGKFAPVLFLAYPLGVLISLGLNVANTLPDLEDDAAFGVSGLAHKLGTRRALVLTWLAFTGAIAGLALAAPVHRQRSEGAVPGIGCGSGAARADGHGPARVPIELQA